MGTPLEAGPGIARPPSIAAAVLIALVRLYQITLSWLLGGHCRFQPSCSAYAISALRNVGAWRGTLYTLGRLSRCHPGCPGGLDPPPPPRARQDEAGAPPEPPP